MEGSARAEHPLVLRMSLLSLANLKLSSSLQERSWDHARRIESFRICPKKSLLSLGAMGKGQTVFTRCKLKEKKTLQGKETSGCHESNGQLSIGTSWVGSMRLRGTNPRIVGPVFV